MYHLLVALDKHNGISYQGHIPWKNRADRLFFRNKTWDHIVIMGRKTYESMGLLKNRKYLVIGTQVQPHPNIIIFTSPEDCIKYCNKHHPNEIKYVIGGTQIYNWFIQHHLIYKFYITHIPGEYTTDQHFTLPKSIILNTQTVLDDDITTIYEYTFLNQCEEEYLQLASHILYNGMQRDTRTNVAAWSDFGHVLKFSLQNNQFPMLTTRKIFLRGVFEEFMFYLRGHSDNNILKQANVNVWTANTTRKKLDQSGLYHLPEGDMGPSYGFNFRHYGAEYKTCHDDYTGQGIDQLQQLVQNIKQDPYSRRHIITLWDPRAICKAPLPPCLYNYQFYVGNDGTLSCKMDQRSSDYFLAGGWNICTGALFTILLAFICGLKPGKLIWCIGDVHIYQNQKEAMMKQLHNNPYNFPLLYLANTDKIQDITDFKWENILLVNYQSHGNISAPLNV